MDREYFFGCHGNYGSAIKTYMAQCQQAFRFHPGPQQDMREASYHIIQTLLYVKKSWTSFKTRLNSITQRNYSQH